MVRRPCFRPFSRLVATLGGAALLGALCVTAGLPATSVAQEAATADAEAPIDAPAISAPEVTTDEAVDELTGVDPAAAPVPPTDEPAAEAAADEAAAAEAAADEPATGDATPGKATGA